MRPAGVLSMWSPALVPAPAASPPCLSAPDPWAPTTRGPCCVGPGVEFFQCLAGCVAVFAVPGARPGTSFWRGAES